MGLVSRSGAGPVRYRHRWRGAALRGVLPGQSALLLAGRASRDHSARLRSGVFREQPMKGKNIENLRRLCAPQIQDPAGSGENAFLERGHGVSASRARRILGQALDPDPADRRARVVLARAPRRGGNDRRAPGRSGYSVLTPRRMCLVFASLELPSLLCRLQLANVNAKGGVA